MVGAIFTDALRANFFTNTAVIENYLPFWTEAALCRIIFADTEIGTILTDLYTGFVAVIIYQICGTLQIFYSHLLQNSVEIFERISSVAINISEKTYLRITKSAV